VTPKPKTVAEWKKLVAMRRDLELRARHSFAEAQEQLEEAAAAKLTTKQAAAIAADRALNRLYNRHKLLLAAERGLKQAKVTAISAPKLNPERTVISPNWSSRGGNRPRLIVLHITVSHNRPGLGDIDAILGWFGQERSQCSSHIINDRDGNDARCVWDANKAWTQAAFNPIALAIEQIEFSAGRTRTEWLKESRKQLDNTAAWVAKWSVAYGIPLKESTTNGVCEHRTLGAAGGGHSDCGPGYPMDYVLRQARQYAPGYRKAAAA